MRCTNVFGGQQCLSDAAAGSEHCNHATCWTLDDEAHENPRFTAPESLHGTRLGSTISREIGEVGRARDLARRIRRHASVEGLLGPHSYLRHDGESTEEQAAEMSAVRNSSRRRQVLRVIVGAGERGVTDDDIAVILDDPDVPAPRVASRRKELEEHGWVRPKMGMDGAREERPTRTGAHAIVWVLTASGQAQLGPWLYGSDAVPPRTEPSKG